jgi:hypothetical protein
MGARRIKERFRRLGLTAVVLTTIPACQEGAGQLPMNQASALVNGTIRVGMGRAEVVSLLGAPHQIEKSGSIEFLFYHAPPLMKAGTTGSNPIAIVEGKVIGTGLIYYYKNRAPQ